MGWGDVDDVESVAALERAFELGITFYDTSDVYGCGHSERILGGVFAGRRDGVVIARKCRPLAQGALGWLWARSPATIPIPGFKTMAQVEENAGAMVYGSLSETQMACFSEFTVR